MHQPVTVTVREQSYYVTLLAEAYAKEGQADEGLRIVEDELARVQTAGTRFYEAELHRVKAELLLAQEVRIQKAKVKDKKASGAQSCYRRAIDIAQRQQAKSLELRAVIGLSRLWKRRGKKQDARQLLTEIYEWFTEGFDTADLKEAKALLDELT